MREKFLGIFPYFGENAVGGIQLSSRLAWKFIEDFLIGQGDTAHLFCYAPKTEVTENRVNATYACTQLQAIAMALRGSWKPNVVLVWHLHLLKLLPFFRVKSARVFLMLLGIEAWEYPDWLTRLLLSRVDCFLTISEHTWKHFIDLHPYLKNKPHTTVYLGLSEPLIVPSPAPLEIPIALIISRLAKTEDYKGHKELLKAWPKVIENIADAQLWIVGKGDLQSDLEKIIEENQLQKHVKIWGEVTEQVKQELLTQSRCFVMPSRREGFGLVYLEAMRLGRPCLVSTLDAGFEVVMPPQAGLGVDPIDEQDLVNALCRLLTLGPEWQYWSQQARNRYESNFTAYHYKERLLSAVMNNYNVTQNHMTSSAINY